MAASDIKTAKVRHCAATGTDIELAYDVFGKSHHPCILLIMGLGTQLLAWDEELCQKLSEAGPYFVVRFDNRDVGGSTKLEHVKSAAAWKLLLPVWISGIKPVYTLHDMAADAIGLLDYLGVKKAHVVGCSMGGMIAQTMAIDFQERVLSLTSIMSDTGNRSHAAQSPSWVKWWFLKKPKSNSIEDITDFRFQMHKYVAAYNVKNPELEYVMTRTKLMTERSAYRLGMPRQLLAIMLSPSREEGLKALKIPVLVFHGLEDVMVPVENGYRTAELIPHAKLVTVPNMGHTLYPSHWKMYVREIDGLVKRAQRRNNHLAE